STSITKKVLGSLISSTTYAQSLVEIENVTLEENISEGIISSKDNNMLPQNELYYFFETYKIDLNMDQEITKDTSDKDILDEDMLDEKLPVNFESNDFDPEDLQEDKDVLDEESLVNFESNNFDPKDLQEAILNNALNSIEGINKPEYIAEWPNDAYCDFIELIVESNIFNNMGDKIIKLFNKNSNLKVSPLPKSTKNGKDYLNQIKFLSINFKTKIVATYSGNNIILHYCPIFRAIQALLQ
ncbi:4076_t:CDS:1, partial [Gigaspora margarita]